ncbi:XTP/dITP diphosphohydrolase [Aquimarina sp. EL_43]|uniref:non-canonical purine NTP diphosphatase n=1 Tax=Aquimarina TaxID=290174 RepID=UPI00046FF975|nr:MULTISPECIES: non-canonical purine NTP diphosphatase [Aquimarina]MBG6130603.1 XTP/dITP diphosphohydrolase [Aquimarina sp. EL_35]MBG6151251.1 XTP/dITP diphosphohydrolase [Aquimarina sp. EL_32]MBG6169005.1 XTP/dITP diphosphohydrolase [Aquimarina sp. EL_43]
MKIVFATNNLNKIKEVQALLPPTIQIVGLSDIGCIEDIPETSTTIEGNAMQKANYIKEHYGFDCFADDTGLEVESLHGAPGVYSARYAGEAKDANANMDKLLKELKEKENRKAQFKTVIALVSNGKVKTFTGICPGFITEDKRGKGGFGYDPVFLPDGYTETFAELSLSEKNKIGHRGKAVRQLIEYFL